MEQPQVEQLDQWYSRATLPNFQVPWACANKECGHSFVDGDLVFMQIRRLPDKSLGASGYYCEGCSKK